MLSCFNLIPERNGQTDRRTDGQTDRFAISISHVSTLTRDNKIVCSLHRIFNRNRKLKQQVISTLSALKLGVCSKINARYIFVWIFFQICQN